MNSYINKVFELADASVKRFPPHKLNWSWGQALYLYAFPKFGAEFNQERYTAYIKYYDHHIKRIQGQHFPDTSRLSPPITLLKRGWRTLQGLLLRGCANIL